MFSVNPEFSGTGGANGFRRPRNGVVATVDRADKVEKKEFRVHGGTGAQSVPMFPYVVKREREANGGFYDLSMAPRFDIAPKIAHAALIEMKYVKAGDPAPTPEALAKIKAEAIDQLDQYSADHDLSAEWHHKGGKVADSKPEGQFAAAGGDLMGNGSTGTVSLHRLVLVFHGGDCVLHEEV